MSKLKGDPGYRAGWCIHYRYQPHEYAERTCEAGVDFNGLSQPWPCFLNKETLRPREGASHCAKLRPPTPDEVKAHEAWMAKRMEKYAKVSSVVILWRAKHQGKSFAEVIECPACSGRLHLSIAACNGHVHGHCETQGCVSWME